MKFVILWLLLLAQSFNLSAKLNASKCASEDSDACLASALHEPEIEFSLVEQILVSVAERMERMGYVSAYTLAYAFDEGSILPRDPSRSFKWFQKCAARADLDCENNVGWYYRNGHGVEQNLNAAKAWFELAGKQGHVLAQANLGDLYFLKDALEVDYELAFSWYLKAAEQGDAYSQDTVGVFWLRGFGVEPNVEEALEWFHKAAAQGFTNAYLNLGRVYFWGQGVDQNFAEGVRWFRKASLAGDLAGNLYLAAAYIEGKGINQNVSQAVSLIQQAADQNYTPAFNNLGSLYLEGLGVPFDPDKAKELFVRGAELGDGLAYVNLASLYEYGTHVPRDESMAMMLYRLGAQTDEPFAHYSLAKKLMNSPFPGDFDEGMTWLESAVELGDPEAQFHLSTILVESSEQADIDRAIELAHMSANAGNLGGKSMVAWLNDTGISGLRDEENVIAMYRKGAEQGDAYSMFQLGVKMLYGEGLELNATEGVRLVNLACDSYYYEDACRFARGNGSFHWHLYYAERGVIFSQQMVGAFYEWGNGVERNYDQAVKWFMLASDHGDAIAKLRLSWLCREGLGVEQNKEIAFQYALESAKLGNLQAYVALYDFYRLGEGVAKDVESGINWLDLAVAKEDPHALFIKGRSYLIGELVPLDPIAAFDLFKNAAERGSEAAALQLAVLYALGNGTELSYEDALHWFLTVSNSQDSRIRSDSLYNLGYMHQEGLGVVSDLDLAIEYYKSAAAFGHSNAETNLGNLYRDGRGVHFDLVEAQYWYSIAASRGHPEAANELAILLEKKNATPDQVAELYQIACKANYAYSCERLQNL